MAKPEVPQVTYLLNQEGKDREVFTNAAKAGEAWHKADVNSKPMMLVEQPGQKVQIGANRENGNFRTLSALSSHRGGRKQPIAMATRLSSNAEDSSCVGISSITERITLRNPCPSK